MKLKELVKSQTEQLFYREDKEENKYYVGAIIRIDYPTDSLIKEIFKEIAKKRHSKAPRFSVEQYLEEIEQGYQKGYLKKEINKILPSFLHEKLAEAVKEKNRKYYVDTPGTRILGKDKSIITQLSEYNPLLMENKLFTEIGRFNIKTEREMFEELIRQEKSKEKKEKRKNKISLIDRIFPAELSKLKLAFISNISCSSEKIAEEISTDFENILDMFVEYRMVFEDYNHGCHRIYHLENPKDKLVNLIINNLAEQEKIPFKKLNLKYEYGSLKKQLRTGTAEKLQSELIRKIVKDNFNYNFLDAIPYSKLQFEDASNLAKGIVYLAPYNPSLKQNPLDFENEFSMNELERVMKIKNKYEWDVFKSKKYKKYQLIVVRADSKEKAQELFNQCSFDPVFEEN